MKAGMTMRAVRSFVRPIGLNSGPPLALKIVRGEMFATWPSRLPE